MRINIERILLVPVINLVEPLIFLFYNFFYFIFNPYLVKIFTAKIPDLFLAKFIFSAEVFFGGRRGRNISGGTEVI